MSTKWNNKQKLQKTPKVCKKVPPPPGPPTNTFHHYPLQAYGYWRDRQTPLEQEISGYTTLAAFPTFNYHEGWIRATRAALLLHLQWTPHLLQFTYTVSLYINDVFAHSHFVDFTDPTDELPFMAGMFTWETPGLPELIRSKIYS